MLGSIRIAAIAMALSGCAATSDVVPVRDGTFVVRKDSAKGWSLRGSLAAEALHEAQRFCADRQQAVETLELTEYAPNSGHLVELPMFLPWAKLKFRCVETVHDASPHGSP